MNGGKLVAFDVGETLVSYNGVPLNWSESYRAAINTALENLGVEATSSDMELSISILNFYNTRVNPRTFEVNEGEIVQKVAMVFGVDVLDFERNFFAYFQRRAIPEPTALETLINLNKAGVNTAVLSDVPYGMPRDFLLEDLGDLTAHLDIVLSSCDVGIRKPNPRGLLSLMKQFNHRPEQVVYVGNEEKDIGCATGAKVRSVLLSHHNPIDYGQTYSVNKLSDILKIVL